MILRRAALALVLAIAAVPLAVAAANTQASFVEATNAYGAGDHARCADDLLALEADGARFPSGIELLAAECLAAAGRFDEAFAFLRRQLPGGRIPIDDLRGKSRPGLDALRTQPAWPVLLADAEAIAGEQSAQRDEGLRNELLARMARDQAARGAAQQPGGDVDPVAWQEVVRIDADNTRWLHATLDAHGWPGVALVGADGAKAAWLLVQHADADPAFQRRALALMETAVQSGDADITDWAMLTDRVLVAEGRPQRYGSQFTTGADGITRMQPAESPAELDARRAGVGLPPMAEYRAMLREIYGAQVE